MRYTVVAPILPEILSNKYRFQVAITLPVALTEIQVSNDRHSLPGVGVLHVSTCPEQLCLVGSEDGETEGTWMRGSCLIRPLV